MIDYLNLKRINAMHRDEIMDAIANVVDSGWYLKGAMTERFEADYAAYIGTQHCVSCGNGLDALTLIFRAYKEMGVLHDGDEVIVPANTYIASILSITENGLKPVLVEPWTSTLQLDETRIEDSITPRTRAILLVHLYGRNAWTPGIQDICDRWHLRLIEDNAQAHGCTLDAFMGGKAGRRTGSLGHAAAHSFYPGKNLGALGDAGAVTTDDEQLAATVCTLGNYGSSEKYVFPYRGRNSRIDELQAAVLSVKLRYLDADNRRRKQIANYYYSNIDNPELLLSGLSEWQTAQPLASDESCRDEACVYHIFPVLTRYRDQLQEYLRQQGIATMIHYPIPPHKQVCFASWNDMQLPITEDIHRCELSIPCNQTMTDEEVQKVCQCLNSFHPES